MSSRATHKVHVDEANTLVEWTLDGLFSVADIQAFERDTLASYERLGGKGIRVLSDVRRFKPVSPEVTEAIRGMQERAMRAGVVRAAQVIESATVALQLNRVAHEAGLDAVLRRFSDVDEARRWLLSPL